MAMIFKQFMISCCCEMFFKFRIVIFIIFLLLPFLGSTENIRKRRRPGLETQFQETSSTTLPDQIAVATNYQGNPSNDGLYQTYGSSVLKSLADEDTPEQFVTKALKLQGVQTLQRVIENPEKNIIPDTSYGKYEVYESSEIQTSSTAPPAYQKDSVTRASFELYDSDDDSEASIDYHKPHNGFSYSTFRYEPQYLTGNYDSTHEKQHEKQLVGHILQSSSTSQIPKAEIFKHIEESVVKYMKNLEAEGKLPIREPLNNYYKAPSIDSLKVYTVSKPKEIPQEEIPQRVQYVKPATSSRSTNKELRYQPIDSTQDLDNIDPQNIEFVYKTRIRSPQAQPQKISFDHAAALKHLEGFDLSHVMHNQEEKSSRPKLFFNSETYRDINSLPYKPEKSSVQRPEYREKDKTRGQPSYDNGDSLNVNHEPIYSGKGTDDGYPAANPYKYYLNPHPYYSKYSEATLTPQPSDWQSHIAKKQTSSVQPVSSAISYDSYNPKYNNNPEGYGYQHNYKSSDTIAVHPTKSPLRTLPKRGKRGGGHKKSGRGYNGGSGVKESETNVALRPPPYKD